MRSPSYLGSTEKLLEPSKIWHGRNTSLACRDDVIAIPESSKKISPKKPITWMFNDTKKIAASFHWQQARQLGNTFHSGEYRNRQYRNNESCDFVLCLFFDPNSFAQNAALHSSNPKTTVCATNNNDQPRPTSEAWVRLSNLKRCASIGLNLEKRMESFPAPKRKVSWVSRVSPAKKKGK